MAQSRSLYARILSVLVLLVAAHDAHAAIFTGTVYFTRYAGGSNVNRVGFTYNGTTHALVLGPVVNITTTPGADGIIFAPDGDLLVGGQNTGLVYKVDPVTGTFTSKSPGQSDSFHLTMDPGGTKFYSSPFGGDLDIVPLNPFANGTTHNVTGSDGGLTQIAFASGEVFYVNGNPNGFGNVGTIDLSTYVTTRLYSSVESAHGMIYDPFTGKITMFGAGKTGTITPGTHALAQSSFDFIGDFDQGAVDGMGHAFVAGSDSLTFIDYSVSGDITNPDYYTSVGGFYYIDDLAPLVGAGSNPGSSVPEPSSLVILGLGVATMASYSWRRRTKAVEVRQQGV